MEWNNGKSASLDIPLPSSYNPQFLNDGSISVDSVLLKVTNVDVETASSAENVAAAAAAKKKIIVSWTYQDEDLGSFLLKLLKSHYQWSPIES